MASPLEPFPRLLKRVAAARLDPRKRAYRQNRDRYKEAIKNLEAILKGPIPWRDNGIRHEARKEMDNLKMLLSEEDPKDYSINDAKRAINHIESELELHRPKLGEDVKGERIEGMRLHGKVIAGHSTDKPDVQADNFKEPKYKQTASIVPPDDENLISFLKELKSVVSDEQEHFSDEVLNWFKNGKNTEIMQALIESIVHQRCRTAKLESELKDCQGRLLKVTNATNSRESSGAAEASNTKKDKDSMNPEETNSIQKQLETLNKEMQTNKYEDKAFKKLQTKPPSKEEVLIENARDYMKKWSAENKEMQENISKLRRGVKERKLEKARVNGDNQWKMDFNATIDDMEHIIKEWKSSPYSKVKSEVIQLKKEVESNLVKESSKKNESDEVLQALCEIRHQISYWSSENRQMQEYISNLRKCIEDRKLDRIRIVGDKQWQMDIKDIIHDVENIVTEGKRLTNIDRAKPTDINPGIADLSDPNRPTKLSEQYLEIYDNEWTDAYEAMDNGGDMKEQQICLELLNILLKAESECREMAKTQYEQLCSRCTSPAGPGENGQLDIIHLSLINDLQKQTAKLSISSVQKKILNDNTVSMKSEVMKYQMKCVEICWYMSLQTPPLVLDKSLKEGQAFDSERYNWYTRKGKYVEFIVWPPLLLHKDGPLLGKGVAQVK